MSIGEGWCLQGLLAGVDETDEGILYFSPWPEPGTILLAIPHYLQKKRFVTDFGEPLDMWVWETSGYIA